MTTSTMTVRVATDTANRIAALRASDGRSTDAVVREALDALYWSRMANVARQQVPAERGEQEAEAALWDRALDTDSVPRQ